MLPVAEGLGRCRLLAVDRRAGVPYKLLRLPPRGGRPGLRFTVDIPGTGGKISKRVGGMGPAEGGCEPES